jgi:hypothetical protein
MVPYVVPALANLSCEWGVVPLQGGQDGWREENNNRKRGGEGGDWSGHRNIQVIR